MTAVPVQLALQHQWLSGCMLLSPASVLYDSSGLSIEEVKMRSQSVSPLGMGEDGLEEALRPPPQ
ncbi:hypothetical protein NQZ68_001607 [Dissostichus eleginoides]|nr:hypothetical protein NQZ68_001607 [Dissostichus eleginoides]